MQSKEHFRVLYAEDDEEACLMLSTMLGFADIETKPAHTASEALRLAQNEQFDLYLLDSRLPDSSGLELCRKLREFDFATPIVFYSGDARESDRANGLAAGANAYLFKPHSEQISETIFRLTAPNAEK